MWKRSEAEMVLLVAITGFLVACGSSGGGLLLPEGQGADSGLTSIDIGLPDRSGLKDQVADIEVKMDGYRLVVAGSGAGCTNIDQVKPYATKAIAASLKQGCDYQLTLSLGNLGSGADAGQGTAAKVSYEKDIKPLVAANCATSGCHNGTSSLSDHSTFAGLKGVGAAAVGHVKAGTMPKGKSLTEAEKKLFADWQAGGFLEETSATSTDSSQAAAGSLKATYYKNVTPQVVAKSKIAGQASIKIKLNLSLQPDGEAIGLVAGSSEPGTVPNPQTQPEPEETAPQLPAERNPSLQGVAGSTTLAKEFKGDYMLVDFSQINCGPCKKAAQDMNSKAQLQAYFTSGKCSHATVVLGNDLAGWHRFIGGADTFTGKHSFTESSGRGLQTAQTFLGPNIGTPTFILIDKQGKTMGSPSAGSIPVNLLEQYCK